LIAAISTANDNGEENVIKLGAGIYTLTPSEILPDITGKIVIQGVAPEATIIERVRSAYPGLRTFTVRVTGGLTLKSMTLRGVGSGTGGGITSSGTVVSQGASGTNPIVLTPDGHSAGGAGAVVRAVDAGGPADLKAQEQQRFSFVAGLRQKEPFTFFLNVLGENSTTRCSP